MRILCPVLLLAVLSWCVEAAIVDNTQQTVYDTKPKLRLRGGPFPDNEELIELKFSPALKRGVDYTLLVADEDTLVLQLQEGKRWANLNENKQTMPIILAEYKDASNPAASKDFEAAVVATVIRTPEIERSDQVLYQTSPVYLYINGTSLGVKEFSPYFVPVLYEGIDYKVTAHDDTGVRLSLLPGARWREEPGPLHMLGVDTGGGLVKLGGEQGVLVAEIQADLDGHGVTVDTNLRNIYQTEPEIVITGEGFSTVGEENQLRFGNSLIGDGVNYTITSATTEELKLKLAPGSTWRTNGENLPGPLLLLAVDVGDGFVAVGPTAAKKGRIVATVYETPAVTPSTIKISRTQSHELNILGLGFPVGGARNVELEFSPPLMRDEDYELRVVSRNQIRLLLKEGKAWGRVGPLLLKYISSFLNGRVPLNGAKGIQVADIMQDADAEKTGGVGVNMAEQKVYQSALQDTITITGTGFVAGMSLVFDNELQQGTDFDLVVNPTSLLLSLKKGKVWASKAGPLTLKSVKVGGETYELAHGEGIRVATIFMNPFLTEADWPAHETQSKSIYVYGSGFTDPDRMRIKLIPTSDKSYHISMVTPDSFRILLGEGQSWFPSFAESGAEKAELKISMIDTGAGPIELEKPIVVASVIADVEGAECDDSCTFAFDGICDDYTSVKEPDFGWGYDDDYGGYYADLDYYGYDDDYAVDDDYTVAACMPGTDCTDCGGIDAQASSVVCENTCAFSRDGTCDDPRGASYCALGTDCQDCGPVGAPNFTMIDDTLFDDDDDMWTGQDLPENFFQQADGYHANKHRIRSSNVDPIGPAGVFISVLEGIVYTTGAVILAIGAWLGWRYHNGHAIPFIDVFNPSFHQNNDQQTHKATVTPDVIRT